MEKIEWDAAKIILALADLGSLSAAALRLGQSVSTISRRLDTIEQSLGVSLFIRSRDGVLLTHAGEELLPHARALATHAGEFERAATNLEEDVAGVVRLGVPPGYFEFYLGGCVDGLLKAFPKLHLEVNTARQAEDLAQREADLVIRLERPTQSELMSHMIADAPDAVLAAADYLQRCPAESAASARWIGWTRDVGMKPATKWLDENVPDDAVVLRANTITCIVTAVKAGAGVALLPAYLAKAEGLTDVSAALFGGEPPELPRREIWLVAHRAVRNVPRIDAVWNFIRAQSLATQF